MATPSPNIKNGNRSNRIQGIPPPTTPYGSDVDLSDAESPGSRLRKRKRLSLVRLRRGDGSRKDHLRELVKERKARVRYFNKIIGRGDSMHGSAHGGDVVDALDRSGRSLLGSSNDLAGMSEQHNTIELSETQKAAIRETSEAMQYVQSKMQEFNAQMGAVPIEIRMNCFSYIVPVNRDANKIRTVYNSSLLYDVVKYFKNFGTGYTRRQQVTETKVVLDEISLVLKPGRMYLVLGPPASGKSTFLRAIAGRLSTDKDGAQTKGTVTYNGKTFEDKTKFHIENAIAFIDQLDCHAPRLTVEETFEYAYQCKRGGTHINFKHVMESEEALEIAARADSEGLLVNTTLVALGLSHVRKTFVGNEDVRGVSGGQRRRVTVGEMLMDSSPILCGDEISNGLDAASTFDMIQILMHVGKMQKMTRVISLLQPSPETVALFDDVILLAEGKLLYAGPISDVENYFARLGYHAPTHMDVADFLQMLSTPDAQKHYNAPPDEDRTKPHTAEELSKLFRQSKQGIKVLADLNHPHKQIWGSARDVPRAREAALTVIDDTRFQQRFANSLPRSVLLNLKRNLTIWKRDKRVLIANAVKNIIMGVSVGGVFYQTTDVVSILGVLFQGMLFIMLGKKIDDRGADIADDKSLTASSRCNIQVQ